MKDEAETCTIIKNSIIVQGGWASKIPDPSTLFSQTSQRPFDIFGIWEHIPLYMEVKYINKLKSFDLSRIEDHQIQNLLEIKRLLPSAYCCIALGVKVARGDSRVYFFFDIEEVAKRRENKQNYLKKELETMVYFSVHKNLIDLI